MSDEKLVATCPACGAKYRVAAEKLGKSARCRCGESFILRDALGDPGEVGEPGDPYAPPGRRTVWEGGDSKDCLNHPGLKAADRCAGCAEPFCEECLVKIQGQTYCAKCKVLAVSGRRRPAPRRTMTCSEAKEALTLAIVGLFCCGIILEPIALVKASKAKRAIAENPRLSGEGMANAAIVIAIIGLCLFVLGVIIRLSLQMR